MAAALYDLKVCRGSTSSPRSDLSAGKLFETFRPASKAGKVTPEVFLPFSQQSLEIMK